VTSRTIAIELKAGDLSVTVSVASIRQILPASGLMEVPLSRPQVAGVMARDGRAIPVYRLKSVAGSAVAGGQGPGPATPVSHRTIERFDANLIVIVEHEGALAGILVESTTAVRDGADGSARILDARTLLTTVGILEEDCGQRAAKTAQGDT
jgi:chemotaxis signal transduction protein